MTHQDARDRLSALIYALALVVEQAELLAALIALRGPDAANTPPDRQDVEDTLEAIELIRSAQRAARAIALAPFRE